MEKHSTYIFRRHLTDEEMAIPLNTTEDDEEMRDEIAWMMLEEQIDDTKEDWFLDDVWEDCPWQTGTEMQGLVISK